MIIGKRRKGVVAVLLCSLMISMFSGCGKTDESGKTTNAGSENGKGRYVESEMALPEGLESTDILQIDKDDNQLCIYAKIDTEQGKGIGEFVYDGAGNWTEVTEEWMKSFQMPDATYVLLKVLKGSKNQGYIYTAYANGEEEQRKGYLFKSTDGKQLTEITPEDWKVEDPEYHFFDCPEDLVVLEDGTIVAQFYTKTSLYSGEDGSLIGTGGEDSTRYQSKVYADGDKYLLFASNSMDNPVEADIFAKGKEEPEEQYPYSLKSSSSLYADVLSDHTIITASGDGFLKLQKETGEWEQIIAGEFTSFSMASMWCTDMVALDSGVYYALFSDTSNQLTLMQYVFDADMAIVPDKELKVYTVYESPALQQAAALFRKTHPDVMVTVETILSYEDQYSGDIDFDSIYQELNAKLIAGEAADVMAMDGLNIDSFIDKGLLEDLSDVVTPMVESGELFSNIVNSYQQEDGKLYVAPARFAMTLMVAKETPAENICDLESLAKVAGESTESILGAMTMEDFMEQIMPFVIPKIVQGKELDKEALKTNLEYLKTIAQNSGIVEKYGSQGRTFGIWEVPRFIDAAICEDQGFAEAMLPISMKKLVNGSFTSFENAYTPLLQLGVNSSSSEKELAKEFVKMALSTQVQDSDFYDGYPINVSSMKTQAAMDRSNYEAYTEITLADGQTQGFTVEKFDEETAAQLVSLCEKLDKTTAKDAVVEQQIGAVLPEYMDGTLSIDEAVDKIESGLKMYLAE